MSREYRALLVKLAIFTVVAVVVTVSVVASLLDLKLGQRSTGYHAVFTNVAGLESGDTVRIAGVEVGKIDGVSVNHRTYQADVAFSVLSSQRLTTTSTATIEFENLLGQRYLAIQPGPAGGQPLRGGATIPESRTSPGLDLTSVFTGFQPLLDALNPQQVNELTGSIIAVLQGESGAVSNLLSQTAALTSNLAQREGVIDEVLDNLTPLLTGVNQRDAQLGQLIDALDSLVSGLAANRTQLGSAVSGLSSLTTNVSNLLSRAQPDLDHDLGDLEAVTGELVANQGQILDHLDSTIGDLPGFLNAVDKVADSGSYLSTYVCNLTVSLTGPISVRLSPTVPQSPALTVPAGAVGDQADHTAVCS